MAQKYLKSPVFGICYFLPHVQSILIHKSISKHPLCKMRFISNAFIVSTVALLSLMTLAVNANVGVITTPASGQQLNVLDSIEVTWYVVKRENPGAVCFHRSLTVCIAAGPSTTAKAWMVLIAT